MVVRSVAVAVVMTAFLATPAPAQVGQTPGMTPGMTPGWTLGPGQTPGMTEAGTASGVTAVPRSLTAQSRTYDVIVERFRGGRVLGTLRDIRGVGGAVVRALEDEDVFVLVSKSTRVVDREGDRQPQKRLARAKRIRVKAKMLAVDRWLHDEDGLGITTIRAERIVIQR
jgi:hypothetical protein